ncbi:hypothetical protein ABIC83_002832 [Roseateles asaccharophilus]|uniref:hypothetical protein n=1 Tax=Roseateles asaccharophilus TaxID=582607 RepID=UPI0038377136
MNTTPDTSDLLQLIQALVTSGAGDQVRWALERGQGTDTDEGRTWQRAIDLVNGLPTVKGVPTPDWPKARDIARLDDMSPDGHLRILLDGDNDVVVEVYDSGRKRFAAVEFCNPGANGGGMSRNTRMALIGVMRAMEIDNIEAPSKCHPRFNGS